MSTNCSVTECLGIDRLVELALCGLMRGIAVDVDGGHCQLTIPLEGRVEPEVVGGLHRGGPAGGAGLQHQVECLGADPAVGVEQHHDAGD